jgi:cytosine deaminase
MIPQLDAGLEHVFRLAMDNGLDLDFHADESEDPAARALPRIAEMAMKHRFPGRIVVGHCCSLALQADAADTIAKLRDAGIAVVSLPLCNMYLQDRHTGRTPRWRGVTLLHEMRAAGVPVAVASDNTRDPFYAYGDLDMLEVFREAVRMLHLDHPIGGWADVVAASPAAIVGSPERGRIAEGGVADFVLFRARDWTELLSRPQSDRTVLRAGRAIDRTLPDYRELDDLMQRAKVHA